MSVLLTQRGEKCPPGPGWDAGTKASASFTWFVCLLDCAGENNFLCATLYTTVGACCLLNVLIMCYSIFIILMAVTIVMQMSKRHLDCTQLPLQRIPESLEYVFDALYTLLHKGSSVQYVHYSFWMTYLATHAFIWRQRESQSRLNLRRLSVLLPYTLYRFPFFSFCISLKEVMAHGLSAVSCL